MAYYQPIVIYRNPDSEKKDSIIRYIGNRVLRNNKNFLCAVVGSTGAGKSWGCLKMAEIYSEMFNIPFDPEIHVISSLKELLELITAKDLDKKIKIGSVIVFDEPQVEGNARSWQSEMNQALSQLISTFRNQRLVVFFATPFIDMIDKQSRILFHGEFKVEGFNKNTCETTIKPRFLEWNKRKGDFYRKSLIVKFRTSKKSVMITSKLFNWKIHKPSQKTISIYEAKKKRFSDKLNKKLLDQIKLSEKQAEGKNKADDFMKLKGLYDKYGADYVKLVAEMPHVSPLSLEKMVLMIKRTEKMRNSPRK